MYWNISTSSCSFLSTPGLAWQVFLKKNEVELELLTDVDILLTVEKGIIKYCFQSFKKTS